MARDTTPRQLDEPLPGFYRVRLAKGAHALGAEIRRIERAIDDEQWIEWIVVIDGEPEMKASRAPWSNPMMERVYYYGTPIEEVEYRYLIELRAWALQYNADHPILHPRRAILPSHIPLTF